MKRPAFIILISACVIAIVVAITAAILIFVRLGGGFGQAEAPRARLFPIESISTAKYSRDLARQEATDTPAFDAVIDGQMKLIAATGANYVAIETPYDPEFIPFLTRWVSAAREYGLHVWFKSNFSGWEGWFGYATTTPDQHEAMLRQFIQSNRSLFQDGDILTPCSECENGGPGDPRMTGDAAGYDEFLVNERNIALGLFAQQGKSVAVYPTMNADIARDILGPATAEALGGVVLIDQYSTSTADFEDTVESASAHLGTQVGLGEFGTPIPDLNGSMTDQEQGSAVGDLLGALYSIDASSTIPVVDYWDLQGGSTALINDDGTPRSAYSVVQTYFSAISVYGHVRTILGFPVAGAIVSASGTNERTETDESGFYQLFLPAHAAEIDITKAGYGSASYTLPLELASSTEKDVRLMPEW